MPFSPKEFIVEEIALDGTVLELGKQINLGKESKQEQAIEKKFTHFILEKEKWNTVQALQAIAEKLRVSFKRFGFAGTKDRNSVSTQLCSVYGVEPEKVLILGASDLKVNGAWTAKEKVRLGELLGNRFTVTLTKENTGKKVSAKEIDSRASKMNYLIPNFFGPQRFGSMRGNTHLVGKLLIQRKFKEAVMNFLCFPGEGELGGEAREKLEKETNFQEALNYFPKHLKYERTILGHLATHENDFIGALRKLPRSLQLLFVHAYQSFLFNKMLEKRIEENALLEPRESDFYCEKNFFGFPDLGEVKKASGKKEAEQVRKLIGEGKAFTVGKIIGYETGLSEEEESLLAGESISKEDFFIKSTPELSSKGTLRALFVPLKDFKVLSKKPVKIRFSLPAGSYATVAVQELIC